MLYGICAYTIHDYPVLRIFIINYMFIDLFIYVIILFSHINLIRCMSFMSSHIGSILRFPTY
jgi:hypothetical protein